MTKLSVALTAALTTALILTASAQAEPSTNSNTSNFQASLTLATAGSSPSVLTGTAAISSTDQQVSQAVRSNTTVLGLPRNIGDKERIARAVVAVALIGVASYGLATDNIGRGLSIGALALSSVPTLTATTGYCPLYHVLGTDTLFLDF